MQGDAFFTAFRIVGYVVLLAMIGALLYAAWITLSHWSSIAV